MLPHNRNISPAPAQAPLAILPSSTVVAAVAFAAQVTQGESTVAILDVHSLTHTSFHCLTPPASTTAPQLCLLLPIGAPRLVPAPRRCRSSFCLPARILLDARESAVPPRCMSSRAL